MFILNNYKGKDEGIHIKRINKLHQLTSIDGNVKHTGIETNSPVQYFCYNSSIEEEDENKEKIFTTANFKKATMINFEITVVDDDKDKKNTVKDNITFENFIKDFGDKKSKEWLKNRKLLKSSKHLRVKFCSLNELLPEFDIGAERSDQVYKLELLFTSEQIEHFRELVVSSNCSIETSLPFNCIDKFYLPILDCLYKVLISKSIDEVDDYHFFVNSLRSDTIQGNLCFLAKDKLIVKFYIVYFLANNYRTQFVDLPTFGLPKKRVNVLLRTIGCTIHKSGSIALDRIPSIYN